MKRQAIREGGAQSQRSLPQERGAMKALANVLIEGLERKGAVLDEDRRAAVIRAAEELLDSNIANARAASRRNHARLRASRRDQREGPPERRSPRRSRSGQLLPGHVVRVLPGLRPCFGRCT